MCISINISGARLSDVCQFWRFRLRKYSQMPANVGLGAQLTFGPLAWPHQQKSQVLHSAPRSPKSGRFYHTVSGRSELPHEHDLSDWAPTPNGAFLVSSDSACQLWGLSFSQWQAPRALPFHFLWEMGHGNSQSCFVKSCWRVQFGARGWQEFTDLRWPLKK